MKIDLTSPEQKAKFMTGKSLRSVNRKQSSFMSGIIRPIVLFIGLAALVGLLYYGYTLLPVKPTINLKKPINPFGSLNDSDPNPFANKFMNPLTGEYVANDTAAAWKDERPIGVMMNNFTSSRPQSGLSSADVVYEVVAEGGITRYLAFFLSDLPKKIGTVRSTREYYLVLVKEMGDAMIMHIGWSPQALEAIQTWPVRSLGRGGAQFTRDQARINAGIPIEHTAYVDGPYLRELGHELGWEGKSPTFESWQFKEDGPVDKSQQCLVLECKNLVIDFWYKGDYTGAFKYDRNTNTYQRFTGYDDNDQLIALIDPETQKQVAVKNIVVQFVTETSIAGDDKNRLDYQLVGSGEALIFRDGNVQKALWRKASRDGRTKFFDESGKEILFNRGKIWVSIVPDRNISQVEY
jgi:hypothetical protein